MNVYIGDRDSLSPNTDPDAPGHSRESHIQSAR